MSPSASGETAVLAALHEQLLAHFHALRQIRDEHFTKRPVFALEHGLDPAQLATLSEAVKSLVARRKRLPEATWLPLVVYAAEIGYRYVGDEYWQTFEEETPGWENEDRYYVRRKFKQFSTDFSGAVPTGPWARHFSIICWPITHAVLPTDLQRQLARLLFEFRFGLTSDLLSHPEELGKALAARSWHASSRFQNFSQNTDLLGQVAAALLLPSDEKSPFLLESTLHRIVRDLSAERQARGWLRDAKRRVVQIRTRGFLPGQRRTRDGEAGGERTSDQIRTDPDLLAERDKTGWTLMMRLPDLSPLGNRLPGVHEELGRLRCRVAGIDGPPLATGRVLYPGQVVRLDHWVDPTKPVLELENGSPEAQNLLFDQCIFPREPWLFRLTNPSSAREIKGAFVRAGHQYLLVGGRELEGDLPPWIQRTECRTAGAFAYRVNLPATMDEVALAHLRSVGLGSVSEIDLWPAGLVPARWDGEGSAEWTAGDSPVIGIGSTRAVRQVVVAVDGVPDLVEWPAESQEIFLGLGDLAIGSHEIRVSLLPEKDGAPIIEGRLLATVRQPQAGTQMGGLREGIALMSYPPGASLAELWDGRATVEVRGPTGVSVRVECALLGQRDEVLTKHAFSNPLPIDPSRWIDAFTRQFRRHRDVESSYDEAETCVITISHETLGRRILRCEREFTPLRWSVGRDRSGYTARLINNTDTSDVQINLFHFDAPRDALEAELQSNELISAPEGGLVRATAGDLETSVILPPEVRDLSDLRRTAASPQLRTGPRSQDSVRSAIRLASMWTNATLPANPVAERLQQRVIRGITARLGGLIGGAYWWGVEMEALQTDDLHRHDLVTAIGQHNWQQALASDLIDEATHLSELGPEKRCTGFAEIVNRHVIGARDFRTSEFPERLLLMASSPGSLNRRSTDEEIEALVGRALETPILFRAARLLVLSVHCMVDDDVGNFYRGWRWL